MARAVPLTLLLAAVAAVAAATRPVSVPLHPFSASAGVEKPTVPGGSHIPLVPGSGEYAITVGLGTPPQDMLVILDSGSSTLAVPTTNCAGCTIPGGFSASKSSTAAPYPCSGAGSHCNSGCSAGTNQGNLCGFSIQYGDGSGVQGGRMYDTLTVGGLAAPSVPFGWFYKATGGFQTPPAVGILGVAYQSINCNTGDPAAANSNGATCDPVSMRSLLHANGLPDVFATCMASPGVFTLGGDDPRFYYGPLLYTPVIKERYYGVYLLDVTVNYQSLGVSSSVYNGGIIGSIVDTGTTNLVLPQTAFNALDAAVKQIIRCDLFNACCPQAGISQADMNIPITLSLVGVSLTVRIGDLLQCGVNAGCNSTSCTIPGINPEPDNIGTIIGQTVLQQYYTVFDREVPRIGFAAAACNATCARFDGNCANCTASPSCMYCPSDNSCRARDTATCPNGQHFVDGVCSLPTVTSIMPNVTVACGGTLHVATGTGLATVTAVNVQSQAAVIVSQTATSIAFLAPPPQGGDCMNAAADTVVPITFMSSTADSAISAGSMNYVRPHFPGAPAPHPGPVEIAAIVVAVVAVLISIGAIIWVRRAAQGNSRHPLLA